MPPARAVVVGAVVCPDPVVGVVVPPVEPPAAGSAAASSVPEGPLDSAVICAWTSASIEPVVFASTATAPSSPAVVTSESVMEASAADWMVLVAITALIASALEFDVLDLSKAEV